MSKKNFIDSNPALNFLSGAKGANDESKSREEARARKKEEQVQEIEEQIEGQLAFNDEGIDDSPIDEDLEDDIEDDIEDIEPLGDEGKSLGRLHLEDKGHLSGEELDAYIDEQLQGYSPEERKQIMENEINFISSLKKEQEEEKDVIDFRGYDENDMYKEIETRSRRLQLLLQPTLYERLREEADRQGRSVNDLIHGVLENYIEF